MHADVRGTTPMLKVLAELEPARSDPAAHSAGIPGHVKATASLPEQSSLRESLLPFLDRSLPRVLRVYLRLALQVISAILAFFKINNLSLFNPPR